MCIIGVPSGTSENICASFVDALSNIICWSTLLIVLFSLSTTTENKLQITIRFHLPFFLITAPVQKINTQLGRRQKERQTCNGSSWHLIFRLAVKGLPTFAHKEVHTRLLQTLLMQSKHSCWEIKYKDHAHPPFYSEKRILKHMQVHGSYI